MGKPFSLEIAAIPETLAFAEGIDVTSIKKYIYNRLETPFLVVGSGGSLAVAQVCALIINHLGGYAQTVTPFELMSFAKCLQKSNVIFFSASGGNPDIINAYIFCKQMEVNSSFIFCLSGNSKLVNSAKNRFCDTNFFELSLPNGKDGFLAVNSTLCAVVLLKKIISEKGYFFHGYLLPEKVYKCLHAESIIALGGRWTLPVVSDFESKCTEAGLLNVMPSDLRNFAHGRHHWLAKHNDTSVICFVTTTELDIAERTLRILPDNVNSCILSTGYEGINATIDLLIQLFLIVQYIGRMKGIDPGKPGVPQYGSRLYRLNYRLPYEAIQVGLLEKSIVARMVKRKKTVLSGVEVNTIENAAYEYLSELAKASFKSIVLDYDNTIISDNNEMDVTYQDCISYIKSFLKYGIGVCFATGRGKSIREQLVKAIPDEYHENLFIAYYNGAQILNINEKIIGVCASVNPILERVQIFVKKNYAADNIRADLRSDCLTYTGSNEALNVVFKLLISLLNSHNITGIKISRSDHSVDIFSTNVTKRNAVKFMEKQYGFDVLCIGDSGDEYGNDFELLDSKYSLSVDRVSISLEHCWNIASLGLRGPSAAQEYLSKLQLKKKGLQFSRSYLLSGSRG